MSQQPTFHITKEHFVGVINSLHKQYVKDKEYAQYIGVIFNSDGSGFYDNSSLIGAIFSFLHEVFPKDDEGNCEIEHYCYVLNFGRNGDEYESPEELYNRLMLAKGVMWFDTPNGPMWSYVDIGAKGSGIMCQIENNQTFNEDKRDVHGALGKVLSDICYPIAPEDAFLPTQEMIDLANVIVITYPSANEEDSSFATLGSDRKGVYMADKDFEDRFPSSHWIRRPYTLTSGLANVIPDHSGLIDKMFPSNPPNAIFKATDHCKTTIENKNIEDWKKGKPSPDETA